MNLENLPRRVKAFGRLWAIKFTIAHPNWKDGEVHEDSWHDFGGYDINLYCEDGYLSVCAYATRKNDDGSVQTNTDEFVYLVRKGETLPI